MVIMSFEAGLRVSNFSPPMDSITKPTPRFDKSASIATNSAVLRAKRSGLVTTMAPPSRANSRSAFQLVAPRHATDLLAEQLGATRAFQVALLRCQTSVLISGAGARVSNQHSGSAYHCLPRHHVFLS
jgi:hypothetical protein